MSRHVPYFFDHIESSSFSCGQFLARHSTPTLEFLHSACPYTYVVLASSKETTLIRFLSEASEPQAFHRTLGGIMSSLFLAHTSSHTFSAWFVTPGPGIWSSILFPSAAGGPGFGPPWFFSVPGSFERLPERGTVFTTNEGTAHLWRAAL